MKLENSSTLPELPIVPSVANTRWPDGFTPRRDKTVLERTIWINSRTWVSAKIETEGAKCTINVKPYSSYTASVALDDIDAIVVAMNILKGWVADESRRYVMTPPLLPSPSKVISDMIGDDDDDDDDE